MTPPANSRPLNGDIPSVEDRQIANQLRDLLAVQKSDEASLSVQAGESGKSVDIKLTPTLFDLLREMLDQIGKGHAVRLTPIRAMLTTQQAADLLNVSRPHLVKLLDQETMPYTWVGRHRRIQADDVLRYKADRDRLRSQALDELISDDADLL
ncbi:MULTISPECIES: helix-turn-helix domain-containing protein [Novosphingobium]|uniref:Helix-turn-helix domain-containing protein n=1 Tax=Novosphingobium decolorationis TaxID=2698673 RepID=A0ABX8E5N9_9SPHN|nr:MULTISPECIES: helix-turn-helix domain-containing protein [Novosphingobium]MED5546221.1 helix-turn-helix domain-containing protein [Pseudomonadota bacterium]QVM84163.1 helix-turn-helix domain-containing protein [Novosphingobium decolorationis]